MAEAGDFKFGTKFGFAEPYIITSTGQSGLGLESFPKFWVPV